MKKKNIIIISILLIIIVVLTIALVIINLPKNKTDEDKLNVSNVEQKQEFEPLYIALDSDIVADMYERINIIPHNIFHRFDGNELNLEKLSDDDINTAAYYYGKLERNIEEMRPSVSANGYSGKLETRFMDSAVKKMFGDIEFNYGNIYYVQDYLYLLKYDETDKVFYRLSGFGGATVPINYSVITEVIEYEDRYEAKEIMIFGQIVGPEYEVRDYDDNVLNEDSKYKTEDFDTMESTIAGYSSDSIAKKILTKYEKQAYGYKHTFMKNSDGTYTWAKTEKLN